MESRTHDDLNGETLGALLATCRDVASVDPFAASYLEEEFLGYTHSWEVFNIRENIHTLAMVYFPKIGKWFDKLLSSEPDDLKVWPRLELNGIEVNPRTDAIPVLDSLFGLEGGFVAAATTKPAWKIDPNKVLMARQLLYFRKRFFAACPQENQVDAVREFWDIESQMRAPRSLDTDLLFHPVGGRFLESWKAGMPTSLRRMLVCLDSLCTRLAPTADVDIEDLIPAHGPGAVSDLPRGGDKYLFPTYPEVIQEIVPEHHLCAPNFRAWLYELPHQRKAYDRTKHAAKLIAVAKTVEKPRLIASEPVVAQFLQQALRKWIRSHMSSVHKVMVSFRSQEPSRIAASKASKDGESATIDLSSASDRMSLWAVESLFCDRPNLLRLLLAARSNHVYDPIYLGETREIWKFAPQGNATTFPVQTLLYANVALAATLVWLNLDRKLGRIPNSKLRDRKTGIARKIRVFGDDIIVPKDVVPYLSLLLSHLGLKINSAKSHVNGNFRESCGMDAYRGYDVTPAYVSHQAPVTEKGLPAWIEISNNAHAKGFWHLAAWIADQVPVKYGLMIPISRESLGVTALKTFTPGTYSQIRPRYSKHLMRWEVKGYTQTLHASVNKRNNHHDLLQYFLEEPTILDRWEAGHQVVGKLIVKLAWVDARSERVSRHT